ncbi:MAG: hypothetical protein PHY09_12455 [Desulfuromonadaceae bacterium]|nr:hypothetical protein [Desulfuromonadaceae bacterium]MDD5106954.1 hypothetical protein [Desulfuromonadaceae bacterium]
MIEKAFAAVGFMARRWLFLLCSLLVLSITGCATQSAKKGSVFFPPEPDLPRVQFLTSISSSEDIVEKKASTMMWLVGKDEEEKKVTIYKPYGVTVHKGKIYVCDLGGRIVVIDPDNRSFTYLDGKTLSGIKKPIALTFDASDNMYVADAQGRKVFAYQPSGRFIGDYGGDLKLKPADVAVDDEYVYVLDMTASDIKVFDRKSREMVRSIGKMDENGTGLAFPSAMAFDSKGIFYVSNITGSNVVKLDRDGHILATFGKLGDSFGDFARPKGVAVDTDGKIYVVDNGMQQVNIHNEAGRLLIPFGAPGLTVGSLNLPVGIAVTREMLPFFKQYADPSFDVDTLIFVTNQYGNAKLSVYGLGYKKGENYDIYNKPVPEKGNKEADKKKEPEKK